MTGSVLSAGRCISRRQLIQNGREFDGGGRSAVAAHLVGAPLAGALRAAVAAAVCEVVLPQRNGRFCFGEVWSEDANASGCVNPHVILHWRLAW